MSAARLVRGARQVVRVVLLSLALTTWLTASSTVAVIRASASSARRADPVNAAPAATRARTLSGPAGFLPATHYSESHADRIRATPARVAAAMRAVRADEIRGLATMIWMCGAPRSLSEADGPVLRRPVFEALRHTDIAVLSDRGDQVVLGAIGQFWNRTSVPARNESAFRSFSNPHYAKMVTSVTLRAEGNGGCRVVTETRAFCADPDARRRLGAYWYVAAPGRAMLQSQWLAAVRRRAESKSFAVGS